MSGQGFRVAEVKTECVTVPHDLLVGSAAGRAANWNAKSLGLKHRPAERFDMRSTHKNIGGSPVRSHVVCLGNKRDVFVQVFAVHQGTDVIDVGLAGVAHPDKGDEEIVAAGAPKSSGCFDQRMLP